MIWILVLTVGAAATFIALGMYSVWFKVMSVALQIEGLVILGLCGTFLWRRFFPKQ